MTTAHEMALAGNHPMSWSEYVGQAGAKRQLQVALASAAVRDARLEHTLIAHPDAGIGKTSLALLVAMELGVGVEVVSGSMTLDEVRYTLAGMSDRDVLVLEECHRLFDGGKKAAEWLLHLMQYDILLGPLGPEQMPRVTLIGTTTDAGKISEPVLQRFSHKPRLESYTDDQAAIIALKLASKVFVDDMPLPDDDTCLRVARASANRPRTMRDILAKIRDLAVIGEMELEENYDLSEVLRWEGLSDDGLTDLCQRYLIALQHSHGKAGVRAIAERLGELPTGLQETERLLLGKRLMERTPGGRMLTTAGIQRAKQLQLDHAA